MKKEVILESNDEILVALGCVLILELVQLSRKRFVSGFGINAFHVPY